MRVLILTSWYPTTDLPYGGVFVREQARALRSVGLDVAVLHIPAENYRHRGPWHVERETDEAITAGFPTFRLTSRRVRVPGFVPGGRRIGFWASWLLHLLGVAATMRAFGRSGLRPDLIHAHEFDAAAVAVALRRLLHGLPVVASEHSSQFTRRDLAPGQIKRARRAFTGADRVLPVSKSLQQAIEAYEIQARFEVVPNAVDTALFHPADPADPADPAAATTPETRSRPNLLFVGRLEPTDHKGLATLLAAQAQLRDHGRETHLDVVGDGPSRPDFEARAESLGLADAVTFRGNQARETVAELMRDSDLFVLSSLSETQGVVLLEAMASGLPVVSTNGGAIPEAVTENDGVLVEPRQPGQLAEAIERVLSGAKPFDRPEIAERASARYGLEAVGRRLVEIYDQVLRERGKTPT